MTVVEVSAISRLLEESRRGLDRVDPLDLGAAEAAGALVVDMRPVEQRDTYGELPGAVVIDRNVLEWRLDPSSPHRLPIADDPERRIVLVCQEGYSSSLAAHTLQRLGLRNATDLRGGFEAWAALRADVQGSVDGERRPEGADAVPVGDLAGPLGVR
jgi:rhodanese-related sulfurtransferase